MVSNSVLWHNTSDVTRKNKITDNSVKIKLYTDQASKTAFRLYDKTFEL